MQPAAAPRRVEGGPPGTFSAAPAKTPTPHKPAADGLHGALPPRASRPFRTPQSAPGRLSERATRWVECVRGADPALPSKAEGTLLPAHRQLLEGSPGMKRARQQMEGLFKTYPNLVVLRRHQDFPKVCDLWNRCAPAAAPLPAGDVPLTAGEVALTAGEVEAARSLQLPGCVCSGMMTC
jgi:hypothetical protein